MSWLLIMFVSFMSLTAYVLNKKDDWMLNNVDSDKHEDDGSYLLFRRPKTLLDVLSSLGGLGIGGIKLMIKEDGSYYVFGFFNPEYSCFVSNSYVFNKYLCVRLRFSLTVNMLMDLKGVRWNWRYPNCLTIYKNVFRNYGVEINTIFPSIFVKQLLK